MKDQDTIKDAYKWLDEPEPIAPSDRYWEGKRLIQWLLDYIEEMELPAKQHKVEQASRRNQKAQNKVDREEMEIENAKHHGYLLQPGDWGDIMSHLSDMNEIFLADMNEHGEDIPYNPFTRRKVLEDRMNSLKYLRDDIYESLGEEEYVG